MNASLISSAGIGLFDWHAHQGHPGSAKRHLHLRAVVLVDASGARLRMTSSHGHGCDRCLMAPLCGGTGECLIFAVTTWLEPSLGASDIPSSDTNAING